MDNSEAIKISPIIEEPEEREVIASDSIHTVHYIKPTDTFIRSDVRTEFNRKLNREDVQDLIDSFRQRMKQGLEPIRIPIEAIRDERGRIIVVAGRRRRRAAVLLGLPTIPVFFVDSNRAVSEKDQLLLEISENSLRKQLDPLDEARAILKLINLTLNGVPAYERLKASTGEQDHEKLIINYIKKMRAALKNDRTLADKEVIRDPIFRVIMESIKHTGKTWTAYADRVLIFLAYPKEIQYLFNKRIIGYDSAVKLNRIRGKEIMQDACGRIETAYKATNKGAGFKERIVVQKAIDGAFSQSREMKQVSVVSRSVDINDRRVGEMRLARNNKGWYFNRGLSLSESPLGKRDLRSGSILLPPEASNDMAIPASVYAALLANFARPTQKILIVGAVTPDCFRLALEAGCMAKHVAPERVSDYVYTYPLDALNSAGYTAANPKVSAVSQQDREDLDIRKAGIDQAEADLAILVLHPYGEVRLAKKLNWSTGYAHEPTEEVSPARYYAKVGSILGHTLSKCKRLIVISRVSEYQAEREKIIMDTPSRVGEALSGMLEGVFYYKEAPSGKIWVIHTSISPYGR